MLIGEQTSFAFMLAGVSISWEARRQRTVSLSSTEADYIAIAEAIKEALYFRYILNDVSISCERVILFNYSQSAQKLI